MAMQLISALNHQSSNGTRRINNKQSAAKLNRPRPHHSPNFSQSALTALQRISSRGDGFFLKDFLRVLCSCYVSFFLSTPLYRHLNAFVRVLLSGANKITRQTSFRYSVRPADQSSPPFSFHPCCYSAHSESAKGL